MNIKLIWEKFSNIGVREKMDFEEIKRVRIINQFAFVSFIISIFYTLLLLSFSAPYLAFFDLNNAILSLIIIFLNQKTNYKISSSFLFIVGPIGLLLFNYVYGKQGAEYYFLPMFILSFYIYRTGRQVIITLVYLIILFFIAKYLESTIHPIGLAAIISPYFYYTSFIFAFIFGYLILRLFEREYDNNRIVVEEKNKLLQIAFNDANKKNAEIKILMKELSHRTKNNLQLVSSLISIQANKLTDSDAKKALDESKNRIISIALIHKKLYQNENLTTVFFKEYIEDLIHFLIETLVEKSKKIEIKKEIDDFEIKIDSAVTLGLILNELLTNSFKYGLINEFENTLDLKIKEIGGKQLEIRIEDSGTGIHEIEQKNKVESFGFSLIRSLVKQMDGEIFLAENSKNSVRIIVKI